MYNFEANILLHKTLVDFCVFLEDNFPQEMKLGSDNSIIISKVVEDPLTEMGWQYLILG